MSFDPVSYIMGKQAGGGGGNPNYIEIIEGTLANPWGGKFNEITSSFIDGNCSLSLKVDGIPGDLYPLARSTGGARIFCNISTLTTTAAAGNRITYNIAGALLHAYRLNASSAPSFEVAEWPSDYATTLTIIHHPLPTT